MPRDTGPWKRSEKPMYNIGRWSEHQTRIHATLSEAPKDFQKRYRKLTRISIGISKTDRAVYRMNQTLLSYPIMNPGHQQTQTVQGFIVERVWDLAEELVNPRGTKTYRTVSGRWDYTLTALFHLAAFKYDRETKTDPNLVPLKRFTLDEMWAEICFECEPFKLETRHLKYPMNPKIYEKTLKRVLGFLNPLPQKTVDAVCRMMMIWIS